MNGLKHHFVCSQKFLCALTESSMSNSSRKQTFRYFYWPRVWLFSLASFWMGFNEKKVEMGMLAKWEHEDNTHIKLNIHSWRSFQGPSIPTVPTECRLIKHKCFLKIVFHKKKQFHPWQEGAVHTEDQHSASTLCTVTAACRWCVCSGWWCVCVCR